MTKYVADLSTHRPHKKDGDKSYEGECTKLPAFEAANEEAARKHCSIEAMSKQKSLRAHGDVNVTVRYVRLAVVTEEEQAAE